MVVGRYDGMSNISKQLEKLNLEKLKLKNGQNVTNELKRHASILTDCIILELNNVYDGYTPKVWKRDYSLYNSIYIDNFVEIKVTNKKLTAAITIHFDEGAYHRNFYGRNMNTAILLNEGWRWKSNTATPYLSHREGTHFIEKGIARYKKSVTSPFTVKLNILNEERTF